MLTVVVVLLYVGCSTSKNTAGSRWWHSFNTRYNVYYNGAQAYIGGSLEKENGNKDNFTEIIPLYTVGNKASIDLGKSNFETAITKSEKAIQLHSIKRKPVWGSSKRKTAKDVEWLNRREYNPFMWKVWMLMGRAQFYKGAFEDAASTFSYMGRLYATQPAIYGKAMAWLAKCYIEQGWIYDAEDVIRNIKRDSLDWRAVKEWDYTYADYYIKTNQYDQAIPYLRKVIKHEMRRKQKARQWYLMGQLEAALGHKDLSYKAFRNVIKQNPSYELEFNARIASTEVMPNEQPDKIRKTLRRIASNNKNIDYLDQVYYAIGNTYLTQKDTLKAIAAYEEGNKKSTRNGIEKGVLLLQLGDLYWAKEKFSDANRCYNEAIGLLDKDRKDYQQLSNRAKILDKLVPYTEEVHLQDSLQSLAKMNETDRNAAIDRVIDALKKKEKEEENARADSAAQAIQMQNGGTGINNTPANINNNQSGAWYFYNPMAVNQGKAAFQKIWGRRENVDNWQRVNKTVVASFNNNDVSPQQQDSIDIAQARQDSLDNIELTPDKDPHKREYYLAQIPFTPEQVQESNKILGDGLYNSGVIFKDELDNLPLSRKALLRLTNDYPGEHTDDAYYHLFLLFSRLGEPQRANTYVQKLKTQYPNSQWTPILADPYFEENAKYGEHLEDSLYAATYDAFKADRYGEVAGNRHISDTRFPMGQNRDKFLFIGGLSKLNAGDADGCLVDMNEVVDKYPQSRISEMAGMIVNGVNQGKRLRGGKFDLSDIWSRRTAVLNDSDSIQAKVFSTDRNVKFTFMLAYNPDSVNENKLLFALAKYNFTSFLVRNFDINIENIDGLHRMQISGFNNYDEALQYARSVYQQQSIVELINKARPIVISEPNIELLGTQFSYDDYDKFYLKHFAPLKVSTYYLLMEPSEIVSEKEEEPTVEEIDRALDDDNFIENGFDIPTENQDENQQPTEQGAIVVPTDEEQTVVETGTIVIPEDNAEQQKADTDVIENQAPAINESTIVIPQEQVDDTEIGTTVIPNETPQTQEPSIIVPTEKANVVPPEPPARSIAPKVEQVTPPVSDQNDTGIYFDDELGNNNVPANTSGNANNEAPPTKQDGQDLEDEYYDLDGF